MAAEPSGPVTPRLAATLIVMRDVDHGAVETLMVVRHEAMAFASGALVFPGGSVDRADHAFAEKAGGADPADLALRVAAIREVFEESGILLADDRITGEPVTAERAEALAEVGRDVAAHGATAFAELLESAGLIPAVHQLVPFARWITPPVRPKRFDTHFFMVEAPRGQTVRHDGREAVEAVWIEPRAALERAAAGQYKLVFATRMNLLRLSETATVEETISATRTKLIVPVMPELIDTAEGKMIRIPIDAGYGGDMFRAIDPPAM